MALSKLRRFVGMYIYYFLMEDVYLAGKFNAHPDGKFLKFINYVSIFASFSTYILSATKLSEYVKTKLFKRLWRKKSLHKHRKKSDK